MIPEAAVDRLVAAGFDRTYCQVMDPQEALYELLTEEGLIGYTDWILQLIQDVYGVDLEEAAGDD